MLGQANGLRIPLALAIALPTWVLALGAGEEPSAGRTEVTPPEIILTSQKPPEYPPAALAGRFSGTVTVEAMVDKAGEVTEVKVLACSSPNLGFEQASIDAVKAWRFEPAREGAEPIESTLRFRLSFRGAGRAPHVSAGAFTAPENPTSEAVATPASAAPTKQN